MGGRNPTESILRAEVCRCESSHRMALAPAFWTAFQIQREWTLSQIKDCLDPRPSTEGGVRSGPARPFSKSFEPSSPQPITSRKAR